MTKIFPAILITVLSLSTGYATNASNEKYCKQHGGTIENMTAIYNPYDNPQYGFTKKFCTFLVKDRRTKASGFVAIGLNTFASRTPNIAATFVTQLAPVTENPVLLKGKYKNPSSNFCRNLNGSNISFFVSAGGFENTLGENDICVFGDGSMISAWSLIYLTNGRYPKIKQAIRSKPLNISIP